MKILLTGASSFTGFWFANELVDAGHEVVATFRRPLEEYDGLRRRRIAALQPRCRSVHGCSYGDERFIEVIEREGRWDLLCHHGADVTDYKSPEFDFSRALERNTHGVRKTLLALLDRQCSRIVLTGSVFEGGEGAGSQQLPAFSPYGLSKELTWRTFAYFARDLGFSLGKFVIPNPFGPYEEPRFTAYLMKNWFAGQAATVSSPAYVRDNIHVSLLAKVYAKFVADLPERPGLSRINPSGYPESQGAFTLRYAEQMRERLGLACAVELQQQTDFPEPGVRINTDLPDVAALGWGERQAWDDVAKYYLLAFKG